MLENILAYVQLHRKLMILLLLILLLALLIVSIISMQTDQKLAKSNKQQTFLAEEKKELVRKLAAADVEADILRNSQLSMRKTIEQQQHDLAEQEKMLDFYRQLMTSDSSKKGLELNSYFIKKLTEPGAFYYRFTFVQYAKKHLALKADLSITVEGDSLLGKTSYNFRELVVNQDDQFDKLYFKYFQVVEGQVKFPKDFIPRQFIVDAQLKTKNPKPWQRTYSWVVEE